MQLSKWCVVLLLAALTGCGGSVSFGVGDASIDHRFVVWAGNSRAGNRNGDEVVDANNNAFAFFADNGCLFNFQTGRENTHFCLTLAGDTALYDGFLVRIANVRSGTGVCIAALLDAATGNFIAIGLDSVGREVVFITALHPDFCVI
jgi:hypothetical protein